MPFWRPLRSTPDKPGGTGSGGIVRSVKAGVVGDDDGLSNDPIVRELRTYYDDLASEPLPDTLLDLLQQLDRAERER